MFMLLLLLLLLLLLMFVLSTVGDGEERTADISSGQRYLVVRLHRLGLANRLRSMADFHLIAASTDRHMLISWSPTLDCNASFPDLFVSGITGKHIFYLS